MPLTIPDELLRDAGLSEQAARVEIACRLFALNRLALWPAARWAGLSRVEFETELRRRNIPQYRPGLDDLSDDLRTLDRLGS